MANMRRRWLLFLLLLVLPIQVSGSQPLARLLVATSDGPYVSYSWGDYWETLRHRLPVDIRVFYCSGSRVYAGGPQGLFMSDDYGELWTKVQSWSGGAVTSVLMSSYFPSEPVIFVGVRDGLYRSRDGGENWERIAEGVINGSVNVMSWPGPSLFVGTSRGLFHSVDGGDNWEKLGGGLPEAVVLSLDVSSYFGIEPVVFVGLEGAGVYRSRDGGESFEPVSGEDWATLSVRVIYWWKSSLIVGTDGGLFVSRDQGESWESASAKLEGERILAISIPTAEAPAGSDIIVATDRGVFKSRDGATTWNEASSGMNPATVYGFGTFPLPSAAFESDRRR
jgi:photosystem II stability/assembly factor-like uncharacterized protein